MRGIATRVTSHHLAALAYHDLGDGGAFEWQLDYLMRTRTLVSLGDVVEAASGGRPLPRGSALLTFDDGYRSVFDIALPLMAERSVPGVAFVVAGHVGSDQPFWWEEVEALVHVGAAPTTLPKASAAEVVRWMKTLNNDWRLAEMELLREASPEPAPRMAQLSPAELRQLQAGGIEIGNHTFSHPCLTRCDEITIEAEMTSAQNKLAEILGAPPRAIAYPNGDADSRVLEAADRVGFRAGFLFDHRLKRTSTRRPLEISRLRVSTLDSRQRFQAIVCGLHPAIHHLRGRD